MEIKNGTIYKIKNSLNDKVYIGQTTRSVKERLAEHRSKSKNCVNSRYAIHHAIAKYGFESFECMILETGIKNLEELQEREVYYIKKYNSYYDGYNMSYGGENRHGAGNPVIQLDAVTGEVLGEYPSSAIAHQETGIDAGGISSAVRKEAFTAGGYVWELSENFNKKSFKFCRYDYNHTEPVVQLGLQGDLVKIYNSIEEAGRDNNIATSSISKTVKGKRHTAGGYVWDYYKDFTEKEYEFKAPPQKNLLRKKIPVTQIDIYTGEIIKEYASISEAAREVDCQQSGISGAISGKSKTSGGYIWLKQGEYENFNFDKMDYIQSMRKRPVVQLSKETGEFIDKFDSITEASQCINVCRKSIGRVARGQAKTCGGYVWMYYSEYISKNIPN